MAYFMLFLEGILTFLSPCILPMVPLYLSYFVGKETGSSRKNSALRGSLLFVLGFSLVFIALSIFVNSLGRFFLIYRQQTNWVIGGLIILFGIDQWLGQPVTSRLFSGGSVEASKVSSFMFGVFFAISWTPCVGVYLASVLAVSMMSNNITQAVSMLLVYCLGLGIPFVLSALVVEESQQVIGALKKHMGLLQKISGILMIIFGALIATGYLYIWLNL